MSLAFARPGIVVPDLGKTVDSYSQVFGSRLLSDDEGWESSPRRIAPASSTGSARRQ